MTKAMILNLARKVKNENLNAAIEIVDRQVNILFFPELVSNSEWYTECCLITRQNIKDWSYRKLLDVIASRVGWTIILPPSQPIIYDDEFIPTGMYFFSKREAVKFAKKHFKVYTVILSSEVDKI